MDIYQRCLISKVVEEIIKWQFFSNEVFSRPRKFYPLMFKWGTEWSSDFCPGGREDGPLLELGPPSFNLETVGHPLSSFMALC